MLLGFNMIFLMQNSVTIGRVPEKADVVLPVATGITLSLLIW
jgi:hypothetical protein